MGVWSTGTSTGRVSVVVLGHKMRSSGDPLAPVAVLIMAFGVFKVICTHPLCKTSTMCANIYTLWCTDM